MSFFRALWLSVFILGLAISPFLAQAVGATATGSLESSHQFFVAAANSNNGNGGNGNGGNSNNGNSGNDNNGNGGNGNSGNDNNGNGGNGNGGNDNNDNNGNGGNSNNSNGGNGNGGNGNKGNGNGGNGNKGNGNGGNGNKSSSTAGVNGSGTCATAGHDTLIMSADGRISVHVFPTMPRNVRIKIVTPVDPTSVPATAGTKVDGLLYQILAEDCTGGAIAILPAEVNLGNHYSDVDATGLTEAKFVIAHLDPVDNTWKQELKQAADPVSNFVSATIVSTGFFVVYQAP